MIKLKTKKEIEILQIGGHKLAEILNETSKLVKEGVTTSELNDFAHNKMKELKVLPSFLNYKPSGAKRPFPAALCISINDEIVHGIPNENPVTLQVGDVVKVDAGIIYEGLFTDHAVTVGVGEIPKEIKNLINRTREALDAAIKVCQIGNHIGDIGSVIEKIADKNNLTVIRDLTGHGVGYAVHEDPYVPNWGRSGTGEKIEEGLVIAVEPMFTIGHDPNIILDSDGYTYKTADGSIASQFEHTIAVTNKGPIVVTKL